MIAHNQIQGYVAAGLYDRGLNTLRWALDYMVKAHSTSSDPSVLVAQVANGDTDHAYCMCFGGGGCTVFGGKHAHTYTNTIAGGRPEDMTMARPAYYINSGAPGTDLWASTAAALAAGAALFKTSNPTLSNTYLTHAQQLFKYVTQWCTQ